MGCKSIDGGRKLCMAAFETQIRCSFTLQCALDFFDYFTAVHALSAGRDCSSPASFQVTEHCKWSVMLKGGYTTSLGAP